jgi:GxxExxY protein
MRSYYLTEESFNIRGAIFEVHKELGAGFLESVYQEALAIELAKRRIPYQVNEMIQVCYKDIPLSKGFISDFVCYSKIILEIKAVKSIDDIHRAQLLNYLKASGYKLGFLVNFHSYPKVHIERFIHGVKLVTQEHED